MPPPNANNEWLVARRFGIVIDAGSSGSRLQIYSWRDARLVRAEDGPGSYGFLPKVEKGTINDEDWVRKVEPGISTFGDNPGGVAGYLAPLVDHARENIPPSMQHETSIFLLATAGMRLLPSDQQAAVLNAACDFIKFHTHFRVGDSSGNGRCERNIRIITGEEEGLFGWIAVNYLMDQFTQEDGRATYGFLDMGGASTQIAFEPSAEERKKTKNLIDVSLRLIGGDVIHHQVFVTTWLGYGTNQARERYLGNIISRYEVDGAQHGDVYGLVPDPCLPRNLELHETAAYPGHEDVHSKKTHVLLGTGSYEQCLKQVAPLLNKDAPCPDVPCLFNGVHVPHIDFSASHFIGVSEYWYSSEHVFGLGGAYSFLEFEKAASEFCGREWGSILRQHDLSRMNGTLGGDGEVLEEGRVVDVGKWGDDVEIPRLQMQCFKSAWLVNVLHDGIGMPRIVDPQEDSGDPKDNVNNQAGQKGLGKPMMQSLDTIGDTAISWTLGKMVLEASREIPPLSDGAPIPEPLSNPQIPHDANDQTLANVIRPFPGQVLDDLYDAEFPSIGFILYACCVVLLIIIAFRLRRPLGNNLRRYWRSSLKAGAGREDVSLEEGRQSKGLRFSARRAWAAAFSLFPKASGRWQPMRSLAPSLLHLQPTTSSASTLSSMRHTQFPNPRPSPTKPFPSPIIRSQSSPSGRGQGTSFYLAPSVSPSRPGSPTPRHESDNYVNQSLYSLPRSRNNSQMNLTSLVTRQPSSRTGSGPHTPTASYHEDG